MYGILIVSVIAPITQMSRQRFDTVINTATLFAKKSIAKMYQLYRIIFYLIMYYVICDI